MTKEQIMQVAVEATNTYMQALAQKQEMSADYFIGCYTDVFIEALKTMNKAFEPKTSFDSNDLSKQFK